VLLTYLDESYTKERYFIAALLVPDTEVNSLTAALDRVVKDTMRTYGGISFTAELHGYDIVAAKGEWAGLASKVRVRIGVYNKALQAIADHDVRIIIRSVDIVGLHRRYPAPDHPHSIVLTHLIERVHDYATSVGELALIIADEVDGKDEYRRNLWEYQRAGTWGYRARRITNVVDTIHFAPSTSSRLVQAADLIAYLARRRETHTDTDQRARRANDALWDRILPRIEHNRCWHP
jgi:hypothetical protein